MTASAIKDSVTLSSLPEAAIYLREDTGEMSIIIDKGAVVAGLGCYTICDADEDLLYRQNGRRVRIPVTRRGVGLFLEQQLQYL